MLFSVAQMRLKESYFFSIIKNAKGDLTVDSPPNSNSVGRCGLNEVREKEEG